MAALVKQMQAIFDLKDLGAIRTFVGLRITRDRAAGTITLDQQQYVTCILQQFGYHQCKPTRTPEATADAERLPGSEHPPAVELPDSGASPGAHPQLTRANYGQAVGCLQWIANCMRPDLAHVVHRLARSLQEPAEADVARARRVMRYLSGTRTLGLTYGAAPNCDLALDAFSDSDWAGDPDDSRSTSGGVLRLCGAAVVWLSCKQPSVSLSSSEAEFVAAGDVGREIMWLRPFLAELDCPQEEPTPLRIDNQTAIAMTTDQSQFNKRRHIRIKHHYIRELAAEGFLAPRWVPTQDQLADILTKPLGIQPFEKLRAAVSGQQTTA